MTDPLAEREELQRQLGISIDAELLELALTHRSFAYENGGIPTNERLEFLGDSILGKAVTVMLYRLYPDFDEGELAKRRASLVSTLALAEVGRNIALGGYIRLGRGEVLSGGDDKDSILADTVEAVIGAAFLCNEPDDVDAFVLRLVEPLMVDPERFGAAMDPKTSLQELAVRLGLPVPAYTVAVSGPDHNRSFEATVALGDGVQATGVGSSKKQAEIAAALSAWTSLTAAQAVADSVS